MQTATARNRKAAKPVTPNRYVTSADCPAGCTCEWCVVERETRVVLGMESLTAVEAEAKAMTVTPAAPATTPKPMPAAVSNQIAERRTDALRAVFAQGPVALLAFAKAEQKKREHTAEREWKTYRLWRAAGAKYASAIVTPRGEVYGLEMTNEGVKRFVGCPDQTYVDAINALIVGYAAAGVLTGGDALYRVETKHATIWHRRERAASAGDLEWMEA